MRIGLWNLEPKINNTAMMQVSFYHKSKGDSVELFNQYLGYNWYDKIYVFSLFDFTPKPDIKDNMICGGTGFNVNSKLPKEIEDSDLDYSIFPECDESYIWFSRGCIRNCPFCVVRQKEGLIHSVKPKNLNPKGNLVIVMDNNFFANPDWRDAVRQLKEWNQPVNFQGIDVRLMDEDKYRALNSLKLGQSTIKMAWDNPSDDLIPKFKETLKYVKAYKLIVYVLIGFNSTPEEDLYRVEELRKINVDSFVMPYNKFDPYQKKFSRWVNRKAIFKSVKWEDYK